IGSISSEYMPYASNSAYVMTKAAIKGLSRGLVRELAGHDVSVNTVQPGRIDSDLLREVLEDRFESVRASTPFRRFGDVDEVARLVAYLSSPEADYISGAEIRIDGGFSA
ncbi:SDR family oxidoreductase, partial [Thioclava sp. BHET1]